MIMYLLTAYKQCHSLLVLCACADGSGYRGHTPPTKSAMSDVLALLEHCYWTPDRYDKEQTLPLASLELETLWLAPAPAQQAGLSKRTALSRQSFNRQNASLAVAMARGIKATLPRAHCPTVLTNPEPGSTDFLSARAAHS